MQALGHGAYQRVQAETSTPGELIVLLNDALLKNLRRSAAAIEVGDAEQVNEAWTRAQEITLQLRASLDSSAELAEQLLPLYTYTFRSLVTANVEKDPKLVRQLEAMVVPIRDAWAFAVSGETPSSEVSGA